MSGCVDISLMRIDRVRCSSGVARASGSGEEWDRDEETDWSARDRSQAPLQQFGTSGRYATALYVAATKAGNLAAVEGEIAQVRESARDERRSRRREAKRERRETDDVRCVFRSQLAALVQKDLKFKQFLMDPSMAKSKKLAGVKEFCAGAKFTPTTSNFIEAMAENGRLNELQKIVLRFEEQCMASRNEVKCVITTAQELTPAQLAKVTDSIKGHAPAGSTLKVQAIVDPRLIGGLTASIGEKYFDLSLMTTIKKYEAVIAAPL